MRIHARRLRQGLMAGAGALATAYGITLAVPAQAGTPVPGGLRVTLSHEVLTITGDSSRNVMVMGQTPERVLTLNGDEVVVDGLKVKIGELALIRLDGGAGDDTLRLSSIPDNPRGELVGGEGNDTLDGGLSDDLLDGGPGVDAIDGSDGDDEIIGGDGNDKIIGGTGDDVVEAGNGADQFTWTIGSGSDVINGGDGTDTVRFIGSAGNERLEFTAAVHHVVLSRNTLVEGIADGGERLVIAGFEVANANMGDGIDLATVNDLTGSGMRVVQLNYPDGSDPREDKAIVVATAHADRVQVFGNQVFNSPSGPAALSVTGLSPTVQVNGAEGLTMFGQGGNDVLDATRLPGDLTRLILTGGSDNDTLIGTPGVDRLFGDDGNDRIEGRGGDDVIDGGPGTNVIIP